MSRGNWRRYLTPAAIALGVALVLGLSAVVVVETLSDKSQRDTERHQAAAAEPEAANVREACANLPTFDEIADCIIKQAKATHDFEHDNADLHAQEDVAAWTNGIFWFAALSFLATAGGLVALIATFYSQRQLARDQTRAYTEILLGRVSEHPELGFSYTMEVQNSGLTPAFQLQIDAEVSIQNVPWRGSSATRTYKLDAFLNYLAANSAGELDGKLSEHWIGLEALRYSDMDGSAVRRYGAHIREEGSEVADPQLIIIGTLIYWDTFGRKHTQQFYQYMFVDFDGRLRGTGRNSPRFPTG